MSEERPKSKPYIGPHLAPATKGRRRESARGRRHVEVDPELRAMIENATKPTKITFTRMLGMIEVDIRDFVKPGEEAFNEEFKIANDVPFESDSLGLMGH